MKAQGKLEIKVYNDFVSVLIGKARFKDFNDSVGLMGSFEEGELMGRDGSTVFRDENELNAAMDDLWAYRRLVYNDLRCGRSWQDARVVHRAREDQFALAIDENTATVESNAAVLCDGCHCE